jgi:molecular chaperone GrpE
MLNSSQIHSSQSKKEKEYMSGWQRSRAELDNLKKRIAKQRTQEQQQIKKEMVESLLSLSDNFQAMVDHVPEELVDNAWTKGVLHISRQLEQLLDSYGVTPIKAMNHSFDPNVHEAVEHTKVKSKKTGKVIEVIQTGYTINNEVIRPAKVKVAM